MCTAATLSGQQLAGAGSVMVVSCFLVFSGIGYLAILHSHWRLMTSWFCYLFTSSRSKWSPSWVTFLHVQYCITGQKGHWGGTLELSVPSVCCGQGWLLHAQWSASLLGFCFVMLFGEREPGLWHSLNKSISGTATALEVDVVVLLIYFAQRQFYNKKMTICWSYWFQ